MYLIVDLDNSLLRIDLFKDSLGKCFLKKPRIFFTSVFLALSNRAKAKTIIARNTSIELNTLPYDDKVINIITDYREKGYQIILATGAAHNYAQPIANHLGLFDKVMATNETINNTSINKLNAIKSEIEGDYIYVGDSRKDIPIWLDCKKAILVGFKASIIKILKKNNVEIIDIVKKEKSSLRILLKQLRVYQWAKNMLLFVPALASHQLMISSVFINALTGFIAFSLLASSIYVLNDIVDVDHDRKHPVKKNRPIANGDLTMFSAYAVLIVCFMLGIWLSVGLGDAFLLTAIIYLILNLLYSFFLKRVVILDIILLATFYTLRLIIGHTPDSIPLSPWLLSFSIFLFFSLGLLKRYIDTVILSENNIGSLSGRNYSVNDGNILMSLGIGSGLVSALVLILYTGSDQVQQFYATPLLLIALAPAMLYWISRIWFMASRGLIKSDPVLFTLKDIHSYIVGFCFLLLMFVSKYLTI